MSDSQIQNERGAALVEYALLVALIAVVLVLTLTKTGALISCTFLSTGIAISSANGATIADKIAFGNCCSRVPGNYGVWYGDGNGEMRCLVR